MNINIFPDYSQLSRAVADRISLYIQNKKNALVCLASGHSPIGVFECLVADVNAGRLDLSACQFVALDEWAGIPSTHEGSCRKMLDDCFFHPLRIPESNIHFFDGLSPQLEKEAIDMNAFIERHGPIDIMLVGVGLNGHIAMNEPGTSFNALAHVSTLAEETKAVGQKYFSSPTSLNLGVTLGLKHFQDSTLPILMANGKKKASIIKKALTESPTEQVPASIVQRIPHAWVMLDQDAASEIQQYQ